MSIVPSITDDILAELEAAAKEATPGPWKWDDKVPTDYSQADWSEIAPWLIDDQLCPVLYGQIAAENGADVEYIAKANPATILALLTRLREAERDAGRYRWLRERGDSCQWMNIIRLDVEDFATIDQAIDTAMQEARET